MKLEVSFPDKALNIVWWRMYVLLRDNFTCNQCKRQLNILDLQCHHILPNPDLRLIVENGETRCKECHKFIERWHILPKIKVGHHKGIFQREKVEIK